MVGIVVEPLVDVSGSVRLILNVTLGGEFLNSSKSYISTALDEEF